MKNEVDLSKYKLRTDLLIDEVDNLEGEYLKSENKVIADIQVNTTTILKENNIKKKGIYKTISFQDVTDHDNYKKVADVFENELREIIQSLNLKKDYKTLVIGLGNRNSTPDSLGVKVCDNIIVTRHLYEINEMSSEYHNIASFTPNVMGNTGIEAQDIIKGILKEIEVDLIIIVDALASSKIERLNKTIQLTDTGISPGSGVGNYRKEITKENTNKPVIAIGVPTVVDAATIVTDTINLLIKKIEYMKNDNPKEKLKAKDRVNYLKEEREQLNDQEKNNLLGMIGSLSEDDLKSLITEVLNPIDYNMMVTPKEIDFIIEKLSLLISKGINNVIHELKI